MHKICGVGLEERVLKLLGKKSYTPLDAQGIGRELGIKKPGRITELEKLLQSLEKKGKVARVRRNRYALPQDADLLAGRIFIKRSGEGILQPDDPTQKSVVIPKESTGTALLHDRVLVRLEERQPETPEEPHTTSRGKVIRILERARSEVVGMLQRTKQFLYVVPDDPRIPHDIYVPQPKKLKRRPRIGEKVVVQLVEWPSRHNIPEGNIITVLGKPDAVGVDIESVIKQYSLPKSFPKAVTEEASRLPDTIPDRERQSRRDCRKQNVITIDPEDAQDFDDAFYLEKSSNDRWRIWIHIADVSHYVQPGSELDREAARRGNSTYLVDRVIPMLPERLSNNLCSLKPKVDRLTKCVELTLSNEGKVLKSDFYSAIIQSQKRYTYQQAMAVLRRKPKNSLEKMLSNAGELTQKIRQRRMNAGSLDFDFPDYKIYLNEKGSIEKIEKVQNDLSHQLVEELMLLANEAVAKRVHSLKRPSIYRIHQEPDPERLEEFRADVLRQGIPCGNLTKPREVQKVLNRLKNHKAGPALNIAFLRSLKRARYAIEPLGHYGLGKRDYTHFTSPIRRYADLLVHRSLFDKTKLSSDLLNQSADHLSFTERCSADAEQDSKTVKLHSYLEKDMDQTRPESYSATVIEVRNFGFFVELDAIGISGCIRVSTLEDDFYIFDPKKGRLRGRRNGKLISLGDQVKVKVASVDRIKKQVDFYLVRKKSSQKGAKPARRRKTQAA